MLFGAQLAIDLTVDNFTSFERLSECICEKYGLFELQDELIFVCRVYREVVWHEEINLHFQCLAEVANQSVVLNLNLF